MSWSARTPSPVIAETFGLRDLELVEGNGDADSDEARAEQKAAVVEAAKLLIAATCRPGDLVHVNVSAHANPGHAPRSGWADDMVNVSVSQVPAPAPAGPEVADLAPEVGAIEVLDE